jgi:hypothetical protein
MQRAKTKWKQDKQVWGKEKAAVLESNNKLGQALSMEQTEKRGLARQLLSLSGNFIINYSKL